MRTIRDIENIAEAYDLENDSVFSVPEEWFLSVQTAPVIAKAVQMCFDLEDWEAHANASAEHRAVGASQPVTPASNTGIVKYHPGWGGYDGGVEASFSGTWDKVEFARLTETLNTCKQAADDGSETGPYCILGGLIWKVKAAGATSGFFKYKWVLESRGVKVYIHSNPKGPIPPIRVRFGFDCLCKTDLFEAVATLKGIFTHEGFKFTGELVSRVDMQILLPVDIYDFVAAIRPERVVTLCRGQYTLHCSLSTMRIETITISSKNLELCIYDKRAEVIQSDPVYINNFFRHILQSDDMPEKLTRVEFRFRRGALKRYGVTTFADLKASESALVQVAGREWFRILERDKVRGSEKEIPNAPIWQEVLDAFAYYFSFDDNSRTSSDLRDFKPVKPAFDGERLLKQAAGLLSSVAAVTLPPVKSVTAITDYLTNFLLSRTNDVYSKCRVRQVNNAVVRDYTADSTKPYRDLADVIMSLRPDYSNFFNDWRESCCF